jgi:hypothetical protein
MTICVGAIHLKAMPVILTTEAEIERWTTEQEALKLQRPLQDGVLKVVALRLRQRRNAADRPLSQGQSRRAPPSYVACVNFSSGLAARTHPAGAFEQAFGRR